MRHLLLIAAALLAGVQEPSSDGPSGPQAPDWFGPITVTDPETGEIRAEFLGLGREFDHEQGTGLLQHVRVKIWTKPTKGEPAHKIHLFAERCLAEGVVRGEARGKGIFRFSEGLRVFLDDDVRLWTKEGTLDLRTQVLHCPKSTRLVHFAWPQRLDLASSLVYMDPPEMDWLRLFGAPAPDFEFVGEEFEFDAAAYTFTAGRKGRIRVTGDPLRPDKKIDPTELRSEGPLRLQNLGSPDPDSWSTLHVTGERDVVLERHTQDGLMRTRSDAASIYIGVPPKSNEKTGSRPPPSAPPKAKAMPKAQLFSAVLKGGVRLEDGRGFTANADRLEWSHQDDLLRMTGAPLVEIRQGTQRLQAREVFVDRPGRVVDFKGDISATFLPAAETPAKEGAAGAMTLTPGELRLLLDATNRPVSVHAWKGVRISSPVSTAGAEAIDAEAAEFEWDLVTEEGVLRGAPFARIQQGPNLVVAPLVTFRGASMDRSYMVIKGPKLLRFFTEKKAPANAGLPLLDAAMGLRGLRRDPVLREPTLNASASLLEAAIGLPGLQRIPGRREGVMDLAVSCAGDAIIDWEANLVKLVDSCTVRTQDSTLNADRLFVLLNQGKEGLTFDRVIGLGNVRAVQSQGPKGGSIQIAGETLELRQDPALGSNGEMTVTVVGLPEGRGRLGNDEIHFERMTYNLDSKLFSIDALRTPLKF